MSRMMQTLNNLPSGTASGCFVSKRHRHDIDDTIGQNPRTAIILSVVFVLVCTFQAIAEPISVPAVGFESSGVIMDAQGEFTFRDPDPKTIEAARLKASASKVVKSDEKLAYISLPRLTPLIKEMQLREKPVPEEYRYLGGLTQIRYVLAYPEEHELVIVGPAEPWDTTNPVEPIGKITGRPIIQLDDLIAAMRTARKMRRGGENGGGFGCSIDPTKGVEDRIAKATKETAQKPRPEKMIALKKAIGPQAVKVFNTTDDTRLAFVCVAADCKLKRIALGIEPSPVPGIGTIVESSARAPLSHVWFELAYDPVLVSEDGNAFQISGPRLQVKVGEESFSDKDATRRAISFAKQFNMAAPKICAAIPIFSDLQNMGDLAMITTIFKMDKIDDKVKWDSLPVYAEIGWSVQNLPPPKNVETLVANTNGMVVSGGVFLSAEPLLDTEKRKLDKKNTLKPMYEQVRKMLEESKGPILSAP